MSAVQEFRRPFVVVALHTQLYFTTDIVVPKTYILNTQ